MRHEVLTHLSKKYTVIAVTAVAAWSGACSDSASPTAPTASSPGVAATSSPAGGPALATLAIDAASIESQRTPTGSVTLSGGAPAGGAAVSLTSSNPDIAKVPAIVMVAAGARSAAFSVDTATIPQPAPVTITALYGGRSLQTTLTVAGPELVATFTVRGSSKGAGGCLLGPTSEEADCVLDGSASRGFVEAWIWTFTIANNREVQTIRSPDWRLRIPSRCAFFEGGRGGDDAGGHYVHMDIELQVQDRSGRRSAPARQAARLYPNRLCGFTS